MLIDLPIKPGIVKDNTETLSEGRWVDGDKVRFRNVGGKSYPEVIGGYEAATDATFTGEARGAHAWTLEGGDAVLAFGTYAGLYAFALGDLWNITPFRTSGSLTDKVLTESGSSTVRIQHTSHGVSVGDTVYLYNDTTVAGVDLGVDMTFITITTTAGSRVISCEHVGNTLQDGDLVTLSGYPAVGGVPADEINTTHTISVVDADNFLITVSTAATSGTENSSFGGVGVPAYAVTEVVDANSYKVVLRSGTASSTTSGGGTIDYFYEITPGEEDSSSSEDARAWFLSNFNNDLVANFQNGVLYRWQGVPSSRAATVAATDAPQESLAHMVTPERFLVGLGTEDATTSTFDPMRVAWAKIEGGFTTNDWTPTSTNSAGDFLLAEGSKIVNGIGMPFVSLIWTDTALYQIQYLESLETVYRPDLLGTSCGLIGPHAFARVGDSGQVFWLANTREFMMWQGGSPITVQCQVRDFIFDNLADGQEAKIYAGLNAKFNEVTWFYPDANDSDVVRYATLNYAELHWTIGTLPASSWADGGVFDYPMGMHIDGTLHYHEKGDDADGSSLSPTIESGLMDAQEGETLSMWRRFVPDFKDLVGTVTVSLKSRMRPQDSETVTQVGTVTTATEKVDFRLTARHVGIKLDWSGTNTAGRVGRLSFDVMPIGSKR